MRLKDALQNLTHTLARFGMIRRQLAQFFNRPFRDRAVPGDPAPKQPVVHRQGSRHRALPQLTEQDTSGDQGLAALFLNRFGKRLSGFAHEFCGARHVVLADTIEPRYGFAVERAIVCGREADDEARAVSGLARRKIYRPTAHGSQTRVTRGGVTLPKRAFRLPTLFSLFGARPRPIFRESLGHGGVELLGGPPLRGEASRLCVHARPHRFQQPNDRRPMRGGVQIGVQRRGARRLKSLIDGEAGHPGLGVNDAGVDRVDVGFHLCWAPYPRSGGDQSRAVYVPNMRDRYSNVKHFFQHPKTAETRHFRWGATPGEAA